MSGEPRQGSSQELPLSVRLTLRRRADDYWYPVFGSFVVFLDDRKVARLERGESIELDVLPGRHSVRCRTWSLRSHRVVFQTVADGPSTIVFSQPPRAAMAWRGLSRPMIGIQIISASASTGAGG